jgi:hypothetical protein
MKVPILEKLGIVLVLGLGAMLISPLRYGITGLVQHERFYLHRPTSYWLKMLNDSDARYRQWAAGALGELGAEPGVVSGLTEALNDRDLEVHRVVLTSLRALGPAAKQAVPALREALKHTDVETRELIEAALASIDPNAPTGPGVGGER